MASRRVARVFDLVQYGVSIGLFGTFVRPRSDLAVPLPAHPIR
jgi:hypothetical protein